MNIVFSVLHVASAVFVVGPMAIIPRTALRSLRYGDNGQSIKFGNSIRLFSYLSLIVGITGFGVVGMSDPKYDLSITTPWVLASLVLYVVALLTTLLFTVPALRNPHHQAAYARAAISSGVATLCLAAVVVLMVWKP